MSTDPTQARAAFDRWRARVGHDWLADDPHFLGLVPTDPDWREYLVDYARSCAGEIDAWARVTNRDEHLPQLHRWDGQGHRREAVEFHPDYHAIGALTWGTGVMGAFVRPGRERYAFPFVYLLAQNGEAGHCCPLACTAGMIKVLRDVPEAPRAWLEGLGDPVYATRVHGAQFLTEVQGGSDVGANQVVAREVDGAFRLSGEKWFCSVIDASLFLVTARPEGAGAGTAGLRAFVVPREIDGQPNGFRIRRLKYKLGTRSMASAEVDFDGAWGFPVGDFKKTVEVVLNTSRVFNAVCAAGFLQRAWREADAWARERTAFGQPLLGFPSIARTVARVRVRAAAARAVSFHLVALGDRLAVRPDAEDAAAWRMLVNLNKIWTALDAVQGVHEAIEVLGGNGAIEDFSVLPRLLRDAIVLEAWEGGHGVLCAQLLRDARRGLWAPIFAHLERETGQRLAIADRWREVVDRPDADVVFRDLVQATAAPVAAALLRAQGVDPAIADHLERVADRRWEPLDDPDLDARVRRVVG